MDSYFKYILVGVNEDSQETMSVLGQLMELSLAVLT